MKHSSKFWEGKKVLITGINGFAGSWLAEKLLEEDVQLFGIKRTNSSLEKINHTKDKINILNGDVLDADSLLSIIKEVEPDIVFHLAAQASARMGSKKPFETFSLNFQGTMNLLDAVRKSDIEIKKMQFASSANAYGEVRPEDIPVKETRDLNPVEIYGISKAAADYLCRSYAKNYGMPVVVNRAFHHEGLRCNEDMIGVVIARQIASAMKNGSNVMKFGNTEVIRDLNDVRDIVNGYIATVEKGKSGEAYNLCSGKGYRIGDLITKMLDKFNLDSVKIETDPARLRSKDMLILVGDNSKARNELGWEPKIDFEDTLVELINYYVKTI